MKKEFKKTCFSAGIGNLAEGFEEMKRSYREAHDSVEVGEELQGIGSITKYEELGLYKLISNLSQKENVDEYIPKSIQVLRQTDQAENKELFKTLESYINNNRHIKNTALELFLHPKTVSYRLQQIKDITGIDFDNTDKLLEIQFAIKIIKFLERNL